MIAVDTNILVYAHREDSAFHVASNRLLTDLAESRLAWAIAWPCLHEFLAIVTHSRIYNPPTPLSKALDQVESWLECPSLQLIGESGEYFTALKNLLLKSKLTGPKVHDARIVAICIQNGVRILWSADRDFSRMKDLEILNPLLT